MMHAAVGSCGNIDTGIAFVERVDKSVRDQERPIVMQLLPVKLKTGRERTTQWADPFEHFFRLLAQSPDCKAGSRERRGLRRARHQSRPAAM
jgi:hypothetical protein